MVDISSSPFRLASDDDANSNNNPAYFGRNPLQETKDFDTSFSFPARPSQTPVRHGRQPSVSSNQATSRTNSHRRNASQAHEVSAISQFQSFSFPSTSVQASPRPATVAAFDSSATPTRGGGRGHRRTASEFVGGDSRTGSATKLRHSSVDGGGIVPGIAINEAFEPFPRPLAAHGRRSSLAVTPLRQSTSPEPQVIDLDDAVDRVEKKESADQETPRATHGFGSGNSFTMYSVAGGGTGARHQARMSSNGYTPTRRPMPRARVGFADRVDFISRPLSTISSQSGSSMSTIRHSMSVSSASGYPATSPLRMEEPSYARTSPERFELPIRPRSTDPVLTPSSSRTALGVFPATDVQSRPKSAQAFTEFSSPSKNKDLARKTKTAATDKPASTKPKRKMGAWAHILGRHSKSTLPPHVNSQQLNSPVLQESSPEVSPEPTPVELNVDFNADPTAVLSDPAQSVLSASAPAESFILRPKVSTILEEPDRTSTMIDLDLALDLFNATPSKTLKARNFNSARRSMHSGSISGLSSPSGHRRAESAPSHVIFDPDQYRTAHNGSTSGQSFEMEDVFEEDESKFGDVSDALTFDSSANASGPTSFEGDRSRMLESQQRPASSRADQAHIRFDDAARKLQFHRNSTGGFPQYRRHSQTPISGRPVTLSSETVKDPQPAAMSMTPQIFFSNDANQAAHVHPQPELQQKDSILSRPPLMEASLPSETSSPFTSSQAGFNQQHRGSTTTMATSFVESAKSPSIGIGEPGPEVRSSDDVVIPMVEQRPASSRTPLQPLNFTNNRSRGGMRSVSSTMSLASAAESISRRKRASLGNLSRLLSGNRSSLSVNVPEDNNTSTPKTPKASHRLSRVFKFWKSKPSPA